MEYCVKLTYRSLNKYKPLSLRLEMASAMMTNRPIECNYVWADKASLVGIEVEVENLSSFPNPVFFWNVTEDGSLRNYGREYISVPVRGKQIEYAVRQLFNALSEYDYIFSPRCSIHVHINIRTMTPMQLQNMLLLYLIFERMLFKFVGKDRDKNIHCVPLYDTYLIPSMLEVIKRPFHYENQSKWMKYTSVNLIPILTQGTIEFRHMHGTDDIPKILDWINIIQKLKMYAYKLSTEEIRDEVFALNSNSQYRTFTQKVFGELAEKLIDDSSYDMGMEDGVIQAKRAFSGASYCVPDAVPGTKFSIRKGDF